MSLNKSNQIVVKSKRQISQFHQNSDSRFKNSRFNNSKDVLVPWYDKYNQLHTGLTDEDAERLGKLLGQDLSKTSPFWLNYSVAITGKDLILNLNYPEDELKYHVLKAHYRVSDGTNEAQRPLSDYKIYDEVRESVTTTQKASVKIKAYSLYGKLSMSKKKDILKLYPGYRNVDSVADSVVEANLIKCMERDFEKFISYVEDSDLNTKVLITELVTAGILEKNKNMYKYGKDTIGHNEDAAIAHLNDPENQGLKIALMKELEELKRKK